MSVKGLRSPSKTMGPEKLTCRISRGSQFRFSAVMFRVFHQAVMRPRFYSRLRKPRSTDLFPVFYDLK